jgi:hypothetical protein
MTAQSPERLHYQGEEVAMYAEPLSDYFALSESTPPFVWTSTNCWRGYVGRWEIADSRLYLIELRGRLKDGSEASIATIFPDFPERVFAHWYSGTLRIPQGKRLEYVHMGYHSTFERDLLLDLKQGVVIGSRIKHNGTPDSYSDREGT